jgi:hypothetical protein
MRESLTLEGAEIEVCDEPPPGEFRRLDIFFQQEVEIVGRSRG